jgi:hypothetical protein
MSLSAKLDSITKNQTVAELDKMLDTAVVSISWYGERLVSIEGYEGTVEINQLAAKYLDACPNHKTKVNLKERLDCYNLWQKVERVCKDDSSLNDTWAYKYLVPAKETVYRLLYTKAGPIDSITTPLKGTMSPSKDKWCFSFHQYDFKLFWPNKEPSEKYDRIWVATKEMMEDAYKRSI